MIDLTKKKIGFKYATLPAIILSKWESLGSNKSTFINSKNGNFSIGAIIGNPRSCLRVAALYECGIKFAIFDVLSLTELVFGLDREDSKNFMDLYLHDSKMPSNPFQNLDKRGVGTMIQQSILKAKGEPSIFSNPAKTTYPEFILAALSGFDESSVEFCLRQGINHYVSDPINVPLCKLVSAQMAVASDQDDFSEVLFPIF